MVPEFRLLLKTMAKENPEITKTKKPLIAMKFGGTSVGSAERMLGVADIVADHAQRDPRSW